VMLLLPRIISKIGLVKTMLLGAVAWPIRYFVFALAPVTWAVLPALTLHGFCFACFIVAGFIYVEKNSPADIRSSAQALYSFVVVGAGRLFGALLAGNVKDIFTNKLPGRLVVEGIEVESRTNWSGLFLVPAVITLICGCLFLFGYKELARAESAS
jgi:MFS family permease